MRSSDSLSNALRLDGSWLATEPGENDCDHSGTPGYPAQITYLCS